MRKLLLVDDELEIAELASEYLSSKAWTTVAVTTVAEAEHAIDTLGPFDVAVIDWLVGRSTARGLLERLATKQPECRVVLTSGHGRDILRDNPQGIPVIRKPYSLRTLEARVDALLPTRRER